MKNIYSVKTLSGVTLCLSEGPGGFKQDSFTKATEKREAEDDDKDREVENVSFRKRRVGGSSCIIISGKRGVIDSYVFCMFRFRCRMLYRARVLLLSLFENQISFNNVHNCPEISLTKLLRECSP